VWQVYPVLLREEMTALEDAAVKLITDFVELKPGPPVETNQINDGALSEEDARLLSQYERAMAQQAKHACELLTVLCTKRASLVQRAWQVYLEKDQDKHVKVRQR
jgi:hypothetical protein